MPKSSPITLRLLGAFTIEVSAERPAAPVIRSRKARALLAYLAMKPDGRAGREELATLLWGDTPDAQARHSLRQCLLSLRQDLHVAPDLFDMGRETIGLRAQSLVVDARELLSAAASTDPDELARAAGLWRGAFLCDLALDIEEFDAWRQREQERLAGAAARVFETLCINADASHDGERAIDAAERLVALDPTREDRQRTALKICARYRGRDAALERARQLTSLLRDELAVSPDAATRALVESIHNGEIGPAPAPLAAPEAMPSHMPDKAISPAAASQAAAAVLAAPASAPATTARWRRPAMAAALVSAVSIGAVATLGLATGTPHGLWTLFKPKTPPGLASAIVLPFAVDAPRGPDDQAFARLLAHDLTGHLARYGDLRIVSDRTADLYADRQVDVAAVGAELGVAYAVVGRVQRTDGGLRAHVQLVDTASRMTLWSDHMQREPGDTAQLADELARGFTHALVINMVYARTQRLQREPGQPPAIADSLLLARGAEIRGYRREGVVQALALYEDVLQRAPRNAVAKLGVARMNIIGAMNFIDLDTPPDLKRAETLLAEVLERFPTWATAHYTLGLLQKYRRQFDASLQSFQRSLELNPSYLHARGQVGALLTRMGQPEKGLETLRETIRLATPNDASLGFFYLFAGEAELELGHPQAALDWLQRANAFMPGSPLVQAWLASVYTTMGDRQNAAKYIAALKQLAPAGAERYAGRKFGPIPPNGWPRTRILEGLRLALAAN
jgi:DNA-binding SARP family transcriptional activator/TolB-like protein/Tfp pilus assembly protein PilF